MIGSPCKEEVSLTVSLHQVPSLVQQLRAREACRTKLFDHLRPRILHKHCCSLLGEMKVSACHACAADVQHPKLPWRRRVQPLTLLVP